MVTFCSNHFPDIFDIAGSIPDIRQGISVKDLINMISLCLAEKSDEVDFGAANVSERSESIIIPKVIKEK